MVAMNNIISTAQLADYLNVPVKTIYTWNSNGTGPRRMKVGRYVRYRRQDVELWLEEKLA